MAELEREQPEERVGKWPAEVTLVRHGLSDFNILKEHQANDPDYQAFKSAYEQDPASEATRRLAGQMVERYPMAVADHATPLTPEAHEHARTMAAHLKDKIAKPDVIFVSPYVRTHQTLDAMIEGWPELADIKTVEEERIREQDHGLSSLYGNWRMFNALHADQRRLYDQQGRYWYRFPQGENVPDVRERLRSFLGTLVRDYQGKNVLIVTHHLSILAFRANQERLDAEEFERLDEEEKPINCGVTIYRGHSELGENGKLILEEYNTKLY